MRDAIPKRCPPEYDKPVVPCWHANRIVRLARPCNRGGARGMHTPDGLEDVSGLNVAPLTSKPVCRGRSVVYDA